MNIYLSQDRLLRVLKFLVIFNLMAIPLYIIMGFNDLLQPLTIIERDQTSVILTFLGVSHELTSVSGLPSIELSNNNVIVISEACTAWRSIMAFIALVIASPRTWKQKKYALLGVPIIYVINILRLIGICLVAISIPEVTEFVHTILWREGLMLLIFALWYYWFKKSYAS